jgi:hypothetical protein
MGRRWLSGSLVGCLLLALVACSSGTTAPPHASGQTSLSGTPNASATSVKLLPVATSQPTPSGHPLLLKPAVAVPQSCPIAPVYAGAENLPGLTGVPWAKADPLSSQLTAFLYFIPPNYQRTHTYEPLHTGGGYPDGRSTKILWVFGSVLTSESVVLTGVKLSSPHETFEQTFAMGQGPGPGSGAPSIVRVPTPGCWQLQVNGEASLIMWVVGN